LSFSGYGLALVALAVVVFGAIECPPFGPIMAAPMTGVTIRASLFRALGSTIAFLSVYLGS